MSVERYGWQGMDGMVLSEEGPWVHYEHHRAALEAVEAERELLREKWQDAERLCGVACEERDEAEAETKQAEKQLAKLREALEGTAREMRKESAGTDAGRSRAYLACAGAVEMLAALTDEPSTEEKCEHEWIDIRNKVVESGEACRKCWAIRAGNIEENQ